MPRWLYRLLRGRAVARLYRQDRLAWLQAAGFLGKSG